ncbi:Crp/Fnr family transcriptional regulator [Bacteriovorax sp. Seq25_V]|uniref:Crp/Fnr family transcriptional regulator n=1 Tax=Bacteriovorax sp. Seq25_V TaxID=1201288 RepID=UPI00038A0839|nr:cyclic nucleotide-binding domain-containing protein [Bacteriovorax sp. Seq25_V]EQC45364.1 cyclic nucleotide-binding domain protein [Bacteriovorax sp. Seq25_V]
MATAKEASGGKSGLIQYKPGDTIFNQNDPADCLYIIQKGQIRLFIPKGKGFVDLAILRSGEVIGEMAYFDDKASRRSCSAQAIVSTEVIRISFKAFDKTMQGLNPWFKTIINTLADRLRKTNDKVKELESNSVGFGVGGKVADYKFFVTADVLKILGSLYLVTKTHGDVLADGRYQIHTNKLKYYLYDVFAVKEIKYEELFNLLQQEHYIQIVNDEDNLPKVAQFADLEGLRSILVFLNQEKLKEEEKKIKVSPKTERLLGKVIEQARAKGATSDTDKVLIDLSVILDEFKEKQVAIGDEDLKDAITAGLCDDIVIGDFNKLVFNVYYKKLIKIFPALRLQNAIDAHNKKKAGKQY